jgi:hypothetical protein
MYMITFKRIVIIFLLFTVLPVHSTEALVRFANGEVITDEDFAAYTRRRVDLQAMVRTLPGLRLVLTEMAETRSWVLEGERLGEPRQSNSSRRFDDVYALAVFRKQMPVCKPPEGEENIRQYYLAHPKAFTVPTQVRLARVMLPAVTTVNNMTAEMWLTMQAKAISSGAVSFDAVAGQAGEINSRDVQGDLGWIVVSDDIPLLRTIAKARKNDLLGPIRDGANLYLFLMLDRREERLIKYEEVLPQIPARSVQYCLSQAKAALRKSLFDRYGIVFDDQAISRMSFDNHMHPVER